MEAASYGIPAIAASIQVLDEGQKFDDPRDYHRERFETGIKVVNRIALNVLKHGMPENVDLLNVNIPYHAEENTPIEITRLARKVFKTDVEERHDPRGRPYYWIAGKMIKKEKEGTDVHSIMQKGHVSITPVSLDSTARIDFSEITKYL